MLFLNAPGLESQVQTVTFRIDAAISQRVRHTDPMSPPHLRKLSIPLDVWRHPADGPERFVPGFDPRSRVIGR